MELTPDPDTLTIRRPQDGAPVGSMRTDGTDAVREAVARARGAQRGWATLSAAVRARHLAQLRTVVGRRTEEIADRIVAETGKPSTEALMEVASTLSLMRYYERRAPRLLDPRRVGRWPLWLKRGRLQREPYGVVGVISAWTEPFSLAAEPSVTALFGGNAVVLKPSPHAPFTGALLSEMMVEAGLSEGLLQVVQGGAATGEALVTSGVDRLHLTGAPATGRRVLAAAAPRLLPVSLGLGGRDPALILDDAPLDRAARRVAFGAFHNAGQGCFGIRRVYVVEETYEAFLRTLSRVSSELRVGSAGRVDVGPMVLPAELRTLEEQLADAVERGARVLCGGHRLDPASNVFLPTVLADVTPKMRVMREGAAGPLLPVMAVADEDEAVERANEPPVGISASVWTADRTRGRAVAARLRCGGVSVNDARSHRVAPELPAGGGGESGLARMRGDEGLLSFTWSRFMLEDRLGGRTDAWGFPYRPGTRRLARALAAWQGEQGVRRASRALGALLGRGEE